MGTGGEWRSKEIMNANTLTLVCAKHGILLDLVSQKVPGRVEVLPCPLCIVEAHKKGVAEYKKRFVLGG